MYNVKAVQIQTGLTPETLRAWERRYGAVNPRRSAAGRRLYSEGEVQRLLSLHTLVRRGFRIGEIAKMSDVELTRRLSRATALGESLQSKSTDRNVAALIASLDRFDLRDLRVKMARVRYQLSPREFTLDLVPAVMKRVGELIDAGQFSIAEEHALSQIVQTELRTLYDSLTPLDGTHQSAGKAVFATREGDHHEMGIMLAAITCRFYGVSCQYLGPNFPAASLIRVVKSVRAATVVLGFSYLPAEQERISPHGFMTLLDRNLPPATEIWAGGPASPRTKGFKTRYRFLNFDTIAELENKLARP